MFKTYKDLLAVSSLVNEWNGYNSYVYKTSNRLIKRLKEQKKDSPINSVIIKQLATYEPSALEKVLTKGVVIDYQQVKIVMFLTNKTTIKMSLQAKTTDYELTVSFTKTTLKHLVVNELAQVNHDYIDVIQSISDKVLGL